MPALVNRSVGSSCGTTGAEGTIVWPFDLKKSRNCWRISFAEGMKNLKTDSPRRHGGHGGKTKLILWLLLRALRASVVNSLKYFAERQAVFAGDTSAVVVFRGHNAKTVPPA